MNPKIDLESLKLYEELRQLEGICRCCELLNKNYILKLFTENLILSVIPAYCPICGKKINANN